MRLAVGRAVAVLRPSIHVGQASVAVREIDVLGGVPRIALPMVRVHVPFVPQLDLHDDAHVCS